APASTRQYIAPPGPAFPRSLARPFPPLIIRPARPRAEELSCRKEARRQGFRSSNLYTSTLWLTTIQLLDVYRCSAAALLVRNAGYFRASPRSFSTGNDLTGRGALPMFPAACKLRI